MKVWKLPELPVVLFVFHKIHINFDFFPIMTYGIPCTIVGNRTFVILE